MVFFLKRALFGAIIVWAAMMEYAVVVHDKRIRVLEDAVVQLQGVINEQ